MSRVVRKALERWLFREVIGFIYPGWLLCNLTKLDRAHLHLNTHNTVWDRVCDGPILQVGKLGVKVVE